jgi:CO/xanthine dehydrogenase FAD-binding subunit
VTVKAYFLPESLDEALSLLTEHGSSLMISGGGTHTMMLINNGFAMPDAVMSLSRAGLNRVSNNGAVGLGAMTTMTQVLDANLNPLLQQAAGHVGGWAIRNMATVGGNLMMPAPSGDFAVALLALDATVTLASANGQREISLVDFYARENRLHAGELIAEVTLNHPAGKTAYLKHARRQDNAPAIVTVAAHLVMSGGTVAEASIALNGAAATPIRATEAENVLRGETLQPHIIAQAALTAAEGCSPMSDAIASDWYRHKMVNVFVRRALESLV